jgi:diguanylate cyclase (GGDEF)-like protein/PAS domain S-box-containing protein
MRATLTRTESRWSPGCGAALSADLSALVSAYPGIALAFDGAGRPIAGNALAGALDESLLRRLGDAALEALVAGPGREIGPIAAGERSFAFTVVGLGARGTVLALGREATRDHALRQALVDSRQRYKDFATCASDFLWETDATGAFAFVSPGGALGYAAAELVGRRAADLALPRERGGPLPFESDIPVTEMDVWLRAADGSPACVMVSSVPLSTRDGGARGARGLWRDVTRARLRDQELARLARLDRVAADIVARIREDGPVEESLVRAAGALADELRADGVAIRHRDAAGRPVAVTAGAMDLAAECALDDPPAAPEVRPVGTGSALVAAARYGAETNGTVAAGRRSADVAWDGDDIGLLARVVDHVGLAIEQVLAHQALRTLSATDALTGLLNRRAFAEEVGRRMSLASRRGGAATLLLVDLDHFKAVNDRLGHRRGDAALIDVARLLTEHLRGGDVAARLGGDEFAVWCDGLREGAAVTRAGELIAAAARLAAHSAPGAPSLGMSIGVAEHPSESPETLDDVIGRADAALYHAKEGGRGRVAVAPRPTTGETPGGTP